MYVELDPRLSARENVAHYYQQAKELRRKRERIAKAMDELRERITALEKTSAEEAAVRPAVRVKAAREKQWFEKFRWLRTSGGFLALAGRDAKQNELLVARHLEPSDLFFHADVHGAPATILKNGQNASENDLRECAEFAGAYSSAWKAGHGAVDVYCVKPDQVSKYSHGEYVAKGGFMIRGERKWFRGLPLRLRLAVVDERAAVVPRTASEGVEVVPGGYKKAVVAEGVKKNLGVISSDEVLALLPGDCELLNA
ncbi:MAG: NFACT RNA binding domain-containing protein [Candidatus Micrarchaeota archaeon]